MISSKSRILFLTINALALGAGLSAAKADFLVGETQYPLGIITSTADVNQARFTITDAFGTGSAVRLFDYTGFLLSNQAPASFTLLPGNTGFDNFAALLTNGINEIIRLQIDLRNTSQVDSGDLGTSVSEQERFALATPDFAGYQISRIVLNVDSLAFAPSGGGTAATFDANVQIFATSPVPEPGTLLTGMAMIGITGLTRRRRRPQAV